MTREDASNLYKELCRNLVKLDVDILRLRHITNKQKKQDYTPSPEKVELQKLYKRRDALRHRMNKLRQRWNLPTVLTRVAPSPASWPRKYHRLYESHHD